MEILCSFILVLEWKSSKEITKSSRLDFLEKFLASNFHLWDTEDNFSEPFNRRSTVDLPILRTLLAKFLGSDGLFCSMSMCEFVSFKNTTITTLAELYFRFRRFILLVQTK